MCVGFLNTSVLSVWVSWSLIVCTSKKGGLAVICFGLHCECYIRHHCTKQGIIKTLTHRCQTICRDDEARRAEQLHLNKVFKSNGYPTGFIHRATNKKIPEPHGQQPSTRICISYIKGIGEQIRKICNREGIQVTR